MTGADPWAGVVTAQSMLKYWSPFLQGRDLPGGNEHAGNSPGRQDIVGLAADESPLPAPQGNLPRGMLMSNAATQPDDRTPELSEPITRVLERHRAFWCRVETERPLLLVKGWKGWEPNPPYVVRGGSPLEDGA